MTDPGTLVFVAAVFVLAGLVKGVIGMGLPTIAMGLLAVVMPPVQAAALLAVPTILTNVWQMLAGPGLVPLVRRLWSMMLGVCLATWASVGLMTGTTARLGTVVLGVALVLYAASGLAAVRLPAPGRWERVLSPLLGAATGVIAAATGVFAIPSVPYLQAIGLEKQELVQALGLFFTVSTSALAVNLVIEGGLRLSLAGDSLMGLVLACAGMWLGQAIRQRLSPAAFRQVFLVGLLLLGVHLAVRSAI
ncbi:MAG TPA: sulfite exporter TauE/SafE family protein [Hyphomicrobiaceae bacterium]|nr:sulfite exporter TauE/SafE family protein [Hyphomicrobiaceae bacterium]